MQPACEPARAHRHSIVGQGILELSYGVSEALEVSVQLPFSKEPGFRANGANFELQYVAPHDNQTGPYWGARVEIGNARAALEPKMSLSLEARPIFGYRTGSWHGTLNLSWRFALSGENHQSTFEPSAKLTRGLTAQTRFGVELYRQAAQTCAAGCRHQAARHLLERWCRARCGCRFRRTCCQIDCWHGNLVDPAWFSHHGCPQLRPICNARCARGPTARALTIAATRR